MVDTTSDYLGRRGDERIRHSIVNAFRRRGPEHIAARRAGSGENALPIVSTATETIGEWTRLHSSNLELTMSQLGQKRRAPPSARADRCRLLLQ